MALSWDWYHFWSFTNCYCKFSCCFVSIIINVRLTQLMSQFWLFWKYFDLIWFYCINNLNKQSEMITIFMEYAFTLSIDLNTKTKKGCTAYDIAWKRDHVKSDTDYHGECSRIWVLMSLWKTIMNYYLQTLIPCCFYSIGRQINVSHKLCFVSISKWHPR